MTVFPLCSALRRPGRAAAKRRNFFVRRSMTPRSTSQNRRSQSPSAVSAMPMGSPASASLTNTRSPPRLISPVDGPGARRARRHTTAPRGARGTAAWTVDSGWPGILAERLVWPEFVEERNELIEAGLLLAAGLGGRSSGVLLQGSMHALMASVLLRRAGVDPLQTDAELQPPHRELARAGGPDAGEGRSIVHSHSQRQATFAKQLLASRAHARQRRGDDAAGEHIAADRIADRQGIATLSVPRAEPSLKSMHHRSFGSRASANGWVIGTAGAGVVLPRSILPGAKGRRSSRPPARRNRAIAFRHLLQFARTEKRVFLPSAITAARFHPHRVAELVARSRHIDQAVPAESQVAVAPLVPRLAADPVRLAKRRHRKKPPLPATMHSVLSSIRHVSFQAIGRVLLADQ